MNVEKITGIVDRVIGESKQKTKETKTGLMVRQERGKAVRVEQNVLETVGVFNTTEEEQKRGVVKRWMDKEQTKYVKVSAVVEGRGLVKMEDVGLLFGCFRLLKHARVKVDKQTIETNYSQIAELLLLTDGGENFEYIKEGLSRLVSNHVETNFWWDTISGERIIQTEFHFLEGVDKGEVEKLRIRINPKIVESMEKGYFKVVDEKKLLEMLQLKGYARLLALLFSKKIGADEEKTYKIEYILQLLGIGEEYKKHKRWDRNRIIKKILIPAIKKAADVLGYTIKILVPNYRGEEIMVYPQKEKGKHHDLILGKVIFGKNQPVLFETSG